MPVGTDQLALCTGSCSARRFIKFTSGTFWGGKNDFVEVYHDEGDVNLFNVIRLLRDMDWEGCLLADHSPNHSSDPGSNMGFAFANGYIQGLLRAAREEGERFAQS